MKKQTKHPKRSDTLADCIFLHIVCGGTSRFCSKCHRKLQQHGKCVSNAVSQCMKLDKGTCQVCNRRLA